MINKDVAIIGVGLRFPGNSNDQFSFWNNLINKKNCSLNLSERFKSFDKNEILENYYGSILENEEWDKFNSEKYNIDNNIVPFLDPQLKQLLNCTNDAIKDSKINENEIIGSITSCFIGSTSNDFHNYLRLNKKLDFAVGSTDYSLSNMISYVFDLRGPSITINSACSSSMNSICHGYESIINGDCELSICGGSNYIFDPEYQKAYSKMGIISNGNESKSYDKNADGFVRGEGVGIVILKKLESAIRDGNNIYSIIKGASNNCDGKQQSKPAYIYPSSEAQSYNIKYALKRSNLNPEDIDYFEANAPGMPFLDFVESESISMVFDNNKRSSPLLIGTYKPNMGHLEGASGIGGIIKCCLMLKNKTIAPTLTFSDKINPNIKLFDNSDKFKLVKEIIGIGKSQFNIALNNFGATGSNCCIILSNYNK